MTEHKNQIILELTVKYNNMIFRAERTAEDKNDALDSAIDKIIRQIRKNKTRIEKSLKDTAFKELYADQVDEQVDYEIIKHKTFDNASHGRRGSHFTDEYAWTFILYVLQCPDRRDERSL